MNFKPFLALEASAGSGKTFALSIRFVALILKGAKLNEILALTFTNKAANEMKKRVIETFLHFDEDENPAANALCELLGKSKAELVRLRDARKSEFLQSNLKIQTFDSFFIKIIRSFALNLGLMSDFKMSNEALNVYDTFIKELDSKSLQSLAYYIIEADDKKHFFSHLEHLYQNSCEFQSENLAFPHAEKEAVKRAFDALCAYALNLSTNTNYQKNFSENLREDFKALCNKPLICNFKNNYFNSVKTDTLFLQKRAELIEALNSYAKALENFKIARLSSLLKHFERAKDKIIKDKNTLNFTDAARKAYLLTQSVDKDLIYFRLDGQITHLLIDEFQDTSVIQYEILKPLIAELVSGQGVKDFRSFFYVGDIKQSIYRFRNAKKELFNLLLDDFKQIEKEYLDTNYRSAKFLVEFVNTTFKKLYKENYITQKSLASKENGFIRVVQSKEKDAKEIKNACFEAILEQIEFLQSKHISLEEICILCWKNNDADDIVDFLKHHQIKAFTQSNIALEKKASVHILLTYAKYCIFGDEFYKIELESLFENADFKRLHLDLSKTSLENALYLAKKLKLDLNDIALIQFFEYAKNKENFFELLFEPCELKLLPEQRFGVSVMTVHKSKGLEFKHVILIDSLSKEAAEATIMLEYDLKKAWQLHFKDSIRDKTQEKEFMEFLANKEKLDYENDLNSLYVAFTRACESLIIITRQKDYINTHHPSYLDMLDLTPFEQGELDINLKTEEKNILTTKDELERFEKVPLQKLANTNFAKNEESYFGLAFHTFLQEFNFKEPKENKILEKKLQNEYFYFLEQKRLAEVFQRAYRLIFNEFFQNLIKDKKVLKEQKIYFENELKQLDLLLLDEKEAIIIDYKTGQSHKEEHYEQVRLYKKAIEQITKKQTKAFIAYCLEDTLHFEEL
ncbi:RecB-like helicase [Campylobacter sp. MIT 12-5580]|uniref:RecB-like helicase n=1 Tax=Campylobacter sp. MIT 12-5580 TaxID=2040651 RepID=UPI0010F9C488|nr:RecB-like helicase [Campylobacter sp. MIT 12-5580]TKX29863.1 RecB-like helicase [Campylobacter sp. MIT 12-5580]